MWFGKIRNREELLEGMDAETDRRTIMNQRKLSVRRWKLLVGFFTAMIVFLGLGYSVFSYTSTPSFCASCHEMAPQHVTFQSSAHNQIQCVQCHIEPGKKNALKYKLDEGKMFISHLKGEAKEIFASRPVLSENCEQCHSRNRLITATGDIIANHKGHIEKEIPCMTCHSGVVHAKVAERGIGDLEASSAWTIENAEKLMGEKYEKPNMGTCIDCHNQVNQGKEPWKDMAYILADNRGETNEGKVGESGYERTPEMKAGVLERKLPENVQKLILEAIGQQKTDVKLSMQCFTCHQKISTPKNHEKPDWKQGHGGTAAKELDKCLNCHKDSLWVKKLEKQDIRSLLAESPKKQAYRLDTLTAAKESRNNYFCSLCHAERPDDHLDRNKWLFDAHRHNSGSPEERRSCFVCHDNEKPEPSVEAAAPSDVYCEFCHKGDFEGEPF